MAVYLFFASDSDLEPNLRLQRSGSFSGLQWQPSRLKKMTLPTWALDYPPLEERKFPQRYSGDYFRDTLPPDLYELEQAVVDGDVFTVRKLLQAGVNLNAPLDSNHMTALMISCMMGNWDLIQFLVEDFEADLDGPLSGSLLCRGLQSCEGVCGQRAGCG